MPSRFRFYYDARLNSYYHEIEVVWFGRPVMHIHERNLEGHTVLDLAFLGRVEDQPRTNRAGIQGYWAEVLAWLPSIVLGDERLHWQAVDDDSARLYLPGLDAEEAFTLYFDPATGLLMKIETLRYQSEKYAERWRWMNQVLEWGMVSTWRVPVRAQTQWSDSKPWAYWQVEDISLNADVSQRLAHIGALPWKV